MGRNTPQRVSTFNEFVVGTGGRPLLRLGDARLVAGRFDIAVTLTDNAVVAADLGLASVWDKRVQTLYGSAAVKLEAVFRIGAAQLYINDADFRGETEAKKESLDNLLYIHMVRASNTMDIPLRGHICEPWATPAGLTTAMLALTEERAVLKGPPRKFERPFQLDLKTDQFTLQQDTAIDWASGNIVGYLRVWGHLCPRDYAGAMVSDSDVCANTPAAAESSVGPVEFFQYTQQGFGGGLMGIPDLMAPAGGV